MSNTITTFRLHVVSTIPICVYISNDDLGYTIQQSAHDLAGDKHGMSTMDSESLARWTACHRSAMYLMPESRLVISPTIVVSASRPGNSA
jgi:hypothetical protein